ncbi:signal transducer and activator of transcription 5B [Tetranychus urticae]|uniref:SH2 domain-containing protein n=1 Tax=Tetranychus urticae TaxID=32264 RepID=T1KPX0_TETUR|nr:signal transducer and activator of transcription 5B [Tetranychus urticae]
MNQRVSKRIVEIQTLSERLSNLCNQIIYNYGEIINYTNQIDKLSQSSNLDLYEIQELETLSDKLNNVKISIDQNVEFWTTQCNNLNNALRNTLPEIFAIINGPHCNQSLNCNGVPIPDKEQACQSWCESLTCICLNVRHELTLIAAYFPVWEEIFNNMRYDADNMVGQLVKNTFIIEKQPPQVIRTNKQFQASIRSLIGGLFNSNNTLFNSSSVSVSILSESQAILMISQEDNSLFSDASGEISNSESSLEYQSTTGQSIAHFEHLILKKINRTEKKGTESVTDEKFALLFQATIKLGELVFHVKALSSPLVVIVHGNQENHAWATITWDNASQISSVDRIPFIVPDEILWARVGHVLSNKFSSNVGCNLAPRDLRFLARTAFRDPSLLDFENLYLSRAQFSKAPLPNRDFTFWEWFYSILKLNREHLKDLWQPQRLIHGFISRKDAEDALMDKPEGTFLLRFSEKKLGAISIACRAHSTFGNSVYMVEPYSLNDLYSVSLSERIHYTRRLKYLYPNIPKEQVFKFTETLTPGYVAGSFLS